MTKTTAAPPHPMQHRTVASRSLTAAQIKARDWLPADGAWRADAGRLSAALSSLGFAWPGCVECEWADIGPRNGRKQRWRFSDDGARVMAHVNRPDQPKGTATPATPAKSLSTA